VNDVLYALVPFLQKAQLSESEYIQGLIGNPALSPSACRLVYWLMESRAILNAHFQVAMA
jgi:hypothetical protein